MLDELTYKDLCSRLVQGDSSCIGEIYDLYGDALYTIIFRIVNSKEDAVEILQDTFTKVWTKRKSFNPKVGRLYTWMLHIARNGALNHISSKASRHQKNIQSDDNLVYLSDKSNVVNQMEALDIKGAIKSLDRKYQIIVEMIYFDGYTHQEVSDELVLPLGTVKSRIKIALRELKKLYEYRYPSLFIGSTIMSILL